MISSQRRNEIVDALRRGTVPRRSLDAFAVGLETFDAVVGEELAAVAAGGAKFKAVRGEYGSGKTFFARWLQERAKRNGFAAAEVQISETETPLHRLETVFRRLIERLSTADTQQGAFRSILDNWFYALEEDVLAEGRVAEGDAEALLTRTGDLMERRLASVARHAPRSQRRSAPIDGPSPGTNAPRPKLCWPGSAASPTSAPPPSATRASRETWTISGPSVSCKARSSSCGTPASRGWSSCSTRSRRSSACEATCARRA